MKQLLLRLYLCLVSIFGAVELFQGWKHGESLRAREGSLWETLSQSKSVRYGRYQKKWAVGLKNVALFDANARWTNASLVNPSATTKLLPGSFLNDRLYLMGARLTTSYDEEDDSSVIVTLFGIPGQARHPRDGTFHCKSELSRSIWSHGRIRDEMILYVQLDCHVEDNLYRTCGPPIEMRRMETVSWDVNVEKLSLIWQANLSGWLDRQDLKLLPSETQLGRSIRVHFSARVGRKIHSKPNQTIQPLLTVDIPLATGSVGNVGPLEPFRQSNGGVDTSYFSHPPLGAALCVATFGTAIQPFLFEFVQHHRNVGFEQIVLGVLDFDDSNAAPISYLKSLLKSFVDDGSVVLVPAAAPGMECHTELLKIAFYNSCLYYTKGISEYVGIWDIDEYWIPPEKSETNEEGTIERPVTSQLDSDRLELDARDSKSSNAIMDTMTQLAHYHQRHGCEKRDWCFHGFPSYTVHRRQIKEGEEMSYNTKNQLVHLFERRDKNPNRIWLKSIAQTKYTFSTGYHEFGSCRRPNASDAWDVFNPGENQSIREQSYEQAESRTCRNLRTLGFGSMHHFQNLVRRRGAIPDLKNNVDRYPKDEYIQHYGHAVATQLLQTSDTFALSAR